VACYDLVRGIDQNRYIEAEAFDARGDLADLLLGVRPRVARIGLQLLDCLLRDFETRRGHWGARRWCGLRLHDITLQIHRPRGSREASKRTGPDSAGNV